MATTKQHQAIEKAVENGGNITQAMRDAGYSEGTVNNPSNLTESKGYKELADSLGLTDTFITQALVEDIKAKPGDRSKELGLAIKVKGLEKTSVDITSGGESIAPDPTLAASFAEFVKQSTKE